jgi:protein O-GlcNAc transferase
MKGKIVSHVRKPSPDDIRQLLTFFNAGRHAEVEKSAHSILSLYPDSGLAWKLLGISLYMQGKDPLLALKNAASLLPDDAGVHNNLGNTLSDHHQFREAAESYRRALQIKPDFAMTHSNLGDALRELGQFGGAITSYRRSLDIEPSEETYVNLGHALRENGQLQEALASFQAALKLTPRSANVHYNIGCALKELGQLEASLLSYCQATELKPDFTEANYYIGTILSEMQRHEEAMVYFQKVLSIKPQHTYALGMFLHSKMHCCDWLNLDANFNELLNGIDAGQALSPPFALLAIPSTPAQQKRCAEIFIRKEYPETQAIFSNTTERQSHGKIRLGYFSADFHNHATSYLMAELFERHDRAKFEVVGFSYGCSPNDSMHQRLNATFDRFMEVRSHSDKGIADLARNMGVDIAIDLKGFTTASRTGIFALHPAPVQVSYLGYPGTMGASYIDYLIADSMLIPAESREFYSEKIAYLPDCYQVNDSNRLISERPFKRNEMGLPDDSFVFCCFNNSYKITPLIFDIWMQLLKEAEGSVLWLLEGSAQSKKNLQNEARQRGIAPERLVFAQRMNLPDHLARHQLADLFLDTAYCNAHTTASDALWAGLPVLTYLGNTFAGRVAGSLLTAIGLPDLITSSLNEYRFLALELATHPEKLSSIRQRLAKNRFSQPLFNTGLFTRHIEDAFIQMWEKHQRSLRPDHIFVRKLND